MPPKRSSNIETQTELLKQLYAAINRNDIPAALKFFSPQIERVEPEGFPSSGTYRGLEEMGAHFKSARDTWAEGRCDPEKFMSVGDKMIAYVHVRVRLKNQSEWIDAQVADGFRFQDHKIIEWRSFVEEKVALDWAGTS